MKKIQFRENALELNELDTEVKNEDVNVCHLLVDVLSGRDRNGIISSLLYRNYSETEVFVSFQKSEVRLFSELIPDYVLMLIVRNCCANFNSLDAFVFFTYNFFRFTWRFVGQCI